MKSLVCFVFIVACGSNTPAVTTSAVNETCELRLGGALEYGRTCDRYRSSYQDSLKERAETINNLEYQVEFLTRNLGRANTLVNIYESQLLIDGCVTKEYTVGPIPIDDTKVLGND